MTAPSAPTGARGAEQLGLRVGDDVAHDKFGEGVVLELIGDGDKTEAVVNFRDVGEKRLLARLGAAAEDQCVSCISRKRRIIATT